MSEHIIEPKPKPLPTWREMLDRAMRQTDEACKLAADWKEMYYAAIAERDAARELLAKIGDDIRPGVDCLLAALDAQRDVNAEKDECIDRELFYRLQAAYPWAFPNMHWPIFTTDAKERIGRVVDRARAELKKEEGK